MTAATNVIGRRERYIDAGPEEIAFSTLEWLWKGAKKLFQGIGQYDSCDYANEELGDFAYLTTYKGKKVYTGSNGAIGRLLEKYGGVGHKNSTINYGAAFNGDIYINEEFVSGAADNCVADPLSRSKLEITIEKYILNHEFAHLEGAGEDEAHEYARRKTGLKFVRHE